MLCFLLTVVPTAAAVCVPSPVTSNSGRCSLRPRMMAQPIYEFDAAKFKRYANPPKFEGSEKTIVEFPSPILRAANRDVTEFDDELAELAAEFMRIMYDANGVGVAAPPCLPRLHQ